MSGVDRERIADLLADESLSFRAIGRMTGASDWSVRRIAREIAGDETPMKRRYSPQDDARTDVLPALSWTIWGGAIGLVCLGIWALVRIAPPPEF
jgi:hypothetical protein